MNRMRHMRLRRPWRVGIDVGGTFTDVVVIDAQGELVVVKSPSMPRDPSAGIFRALEAVARDLSLSLGGLLSGCAALIHGSTIATNTVLEGKVARVGLLCTAGFRDALTIRRGIRADPWRHREPYPPPLVPRHLRLPLRGRICPDGREVEPFVSSDIDEAMRQFAAANVEAVAIALLHAYANPAHERAAGAALAGIDPSLPVFLSCEVAPVIGEYARTSTTVAAAVVAPRVVPYLKVLEQRLAQEGLGVPLLLMQSNGGLVTVAEVARNPACLLLSGPSGGVGALRWLAASSGRHDLITMEMGGTSCDLMLMHDGRVEMADELEIAGYHIRIPAVDIHTVSAGGGSIARVDAGGVLMLGPDGAGSEPGPAAYDRGGDDATDTDAQVALGRLPPGAFAGGAISLNARRAREAIDLNIAGRLGLDTVASAAGIVRLQGQALVHAVERVSVERGFDPRRFSLVAVGGAAAIHAATVARRLGCREVLVPRLAGVFCAFGMLNADIRRDGVRSFIAPLSVQALADAGPAFQSLEDEIADALARQHVRPDMTIYERMIDLRYPGQQSSLRIAYSRDPGVIVAGFEAAHQALYGHLQTGSIPQIAALRVTGSIAAPALAMSPPSRTAIAAPVPHTHRSVWIEGLGVADEVPVYRGSDLHPGHCLAGPFIVEEKTTTILVNPGDSLSVDASDLIVIAIAARVEAMHETRQYEVAL
jgi:N-methylhydantoinase A